MFSQVYKRVPMPPPVHSASIVTFYNKVYMVSLKSYLLQFSPDKRPPALSPGPKIGQSPRKASPVK